MNYKKLFARRNDLRKQFLILLGFIILQAALLPLQAAAGTNNYLLESPSPTQAQAACQLYGFQMVKSLGADVYLVQIDRKSTRLNSSHVRISYAVFCLKKKKKLRIRQQ